MYYGGCYDCVDAEAVSDNTEGWYNWGRIGELPGSSWHCPVYFNQLMRSTFTGMSPSCSTMGITLRVENETKNYRGIGDYGTEIRDNTIDRAACPNTNQRLAGNAAIATFNQSWMKVTADTPLIFATLCEGNHIRNSAVGFDLDGTLSFAIRGSTYANCPKPVNDKGRETALIAGSPGPLITRPSAAKPWRERFGVDDAERLHDEFRVAGAKIGLPPTNYPWAYEFHVMDRDGHVLRFGSEQKTDQPFSAWVCWYRETREGVEKTGN